MSEKIDQLVEQWHANPSCDISLHEWLKMSEEEYSEYLRYGNIPQDYNKRMGWPETILTIVQKDGVEVLEAVLFQEETEIASLPDSYEVTQSFTFQDVMLGFIQVLKGCIFQRIVDERENFSDGFLIIPESQIIGNLNFKPYYK